MRALIFAKRFSSDGRNKWLVDDLVDELAERGWQVQVVLFDLQGEWSYGQYRVSENVSVFAFPVLDRTPRYLPGKYLVFLKNWIRASVACRRRDFGDCDLLINFSIASIFYGLAKSLMRRHSRLRSLLILWDFFPIHQLEIGKIRSRLLGRLLYQMENREIRAYQNVALMSERNIEFFRRYHSNYSGHVFKLPVWGREVRQNPSSDDLAEYIDGDKFNIVFGGQLAKGRGIVQLIDLMRDYSRELQDVNLVIIGDGELRSYIESRIDREKIESIRLLPRIDRQSYMALIRHCDAGLVVTVSGVSVPTFPSKVIDYMKAKLPVLASVEPVTDFGDYVEQVARCGLKSSAGDNAKLVENILTLKNNPSLCRKLGAQGYACFEDYFAVDRVVDRLFEELGLPESRTQ